LDDGVRFECETLASARRIFGFVVDDGVDEFLDRLVVPLDSATAIYGQQPVVVPVSALEAGTSTSQVAVVPQVRPLRMDHFSPGVVGRLSPATLQRINQVLRLVLDLP
jgi:mRNA-degrading endonuclease toxin of MazEF toxin-antitoxin module